MDNGNLVQGGNPRNSPKGRTKKPFGRTTHRKEKKTFVKNSMKERKSFNICMQNKNLHAKQNFPCQTKYAYKTKFASREEKILGNKQDERETLSWKTA